MSIIIKPVITEKMTDQTEKFNRYAFVVDKSANKIQIRRAVEQQYDVSVLLSKNENFALSILESLRHSIPVLTTNNTPWSNIKHHNAGWYIDMKKDNLKKILKNIFEINNNDLLEMSKNAYKLSLEYKWDKISSQYENIYKKL